MEVSNNNSSTSRKRQRIEDDSVPEFYDSDQSLSLEDTLIFSDTMAALKMMRAQFPRNDKVTVEPFILRAQLYSSVKDRTQVDRELESLRREKLLRTFKLYTGQDDHAVMFIEDYLNQCSLLSVGGKVIDEDISLLINAGLLTRQLIDPDMYWFAIPYIGSVLKGLTQGRKELLSLLNRKKYKEIMLALLEKRCLLLLPLDIRFHLHDLLGSGHLRTVHTPSGLVIRTVKD